MRWDTRHDLNILKQTNMFMLPYKRLDEDDTCMENKDGYCINDWHVYKIIYV